MPHFMLGSLTRFYAESGGVGDLQRDADPDVIAGAVSAWRHWLNKELPHALDWDESPTAPFDAAVVGETEWAALCQAAGNPDQLIKPTLWLPGDHDFLFRARDLREELRWIGSAVELLRELQAIKPESGNTALGSFQALARRSVLYNLPLIRG
ncbi:MAG: hypothetical protein IPK87_04140 [Planctomycetes bacterium]|nr:hypothetical protein [Planctomycetota bacterium]